MARSVTQALTRVANDGAGRLKRLRPPLEGYRLRVRDWRVLLYLDREAATLTVRTIEHRSQAYNGR